MLRSAAECGEAPSGAPGAGCHAGGRGGAAAPFSGPVCGGTPAQNRALSFPAHPGNSVLVPPPPAVLSEAPLSALHGVPFKPGGLKAHTVQAPRAQWPTCGGDEVAGGLKASGGRHEGAEPGGYASGAGDEDGVQGGASDMGLRTAFFLPGHAGPLEFGNEDAAFT